MTTATLDPERLRRALHLEAERVGGGVWCVGEWRVDGETGACNCPDATIRRVECKHVLAVKLAALDPDIRAALIEVAS